MRKRFAAISQNKALRRTLCLSIALGTIAGGAQNPTEQVNPLLSSEAYGRILNVVFQREEPKASELQYAIFVRFMSSVHSESQIVIEMGINGKGQAWLFRVSGSSVWNVANEYIQKTGHEDIVQIARLVQHESAGGANLTRSGGSLA